RAGGCPDESGAPVRGRTPDERLTRPRIAVQGAEKYAVSAEQVEEDIDRILDELRMAQLLGA
ncbi:hypothetical protein, partial [Streptomyces sp. NPDC005568]|uniref:hypothetical protein n=1 Tax=Streptomyces sp. NPDC005568 TaxID=3156887 RepID=UPI0033ACCE19